MTSISSALRPAVSRRSFVTGIGLAFAAVAVTARAADAATVYTAQGTTIYKNGVRMATALSSSVATNLTNNLNASPPPASNYTVSGSNGLYRTSQSRVVATATSAANATALVKTLSTNYTAAHPTVPAAPVLATPDTSTPGQVTLSWTPPANNGGSAITGYEVRIDGVLQ
jgi:hypothetical protein